jgi:hypothetical protein
MEVRNLQQYAYEYEYEYKQIGDTWIKTGPWRASTTGRALGAGIGRAGEFVTPITP